METKQFLEKLWNRGIRQVKMTWDCGNDSGSITDLEVLPQVKDYSGIDDDLRALAWDVYEHLYDGATTGPFSNFGFVEIQIMEGGKYKAKVENEYTDYEKSDIYDKKTGEYEEDPNYESEKTDLDDYELPGLD